MSSARRNQRSRTDCLKHCVDRSSGSYHRSTSVIISTRQDVLEALRSLSEEVLASLRLLFCMLFSMTSANQPQEPVSEQEMHPIQQLIQEVKNQRNKIMELSNIISSQFNRSTGKRAPSPTGTETVSGASWDVAEMEEIMQELATPELPKSLHAQGPSTSPPRSSNNANEPTDKHSTSSSVTDCRHAHQWVPASSSTSNPSSSPRSKWKPTRWPSLQTALESWGQKVVTWGKKNKGQVYVNVYEKDVGYVKWVLARVGNLHEDIEDFANYAITRRRLHGERSDAERAPVNEWQPIPESRTAMACHVKSPCHVRDVDEAAMA